MKFKFKDGTVIKIKRNSYNSWFRANGMFQHLAYVKIDGTYQKCHIRFCDLEINVILQSTRELYCKQKISKLRRHLLLIFLNQHSLNYRYYEVKKWFKKMKQPVRVIVIAAVLSLIVHFMNHWTDNAVYDFVDKNPLMKSFMFFLTLGGFIGIFFPFTLQKSIDEMDVRSIYEKKQKEDEQNRRIEQEATF